MLPSQTDTSEHTPKTHCFFVAGGSFLVSIWSSYGFCHLPLGVSLSCEKCGLETQHESAPVYSDYNSKRRLSESSPSVGNRLLLDRNLPRFLPQNVAAKFPCPSGF